MTNSRPLRVAWLIWGDEVGGVASALLSNAGLIRSRGHQVLLLYLEGGELIDRAAGLGWECRRIVHRAGSHAEYLAPGVNFAGLRRRLRTLWRLRDPVDRAAAEARLDLLCTPWVDWLPLIGGAGRREGFGVVLEMPGAPGHYPFAINQRVYAWAVRRWRVLPLANSDYSARRMSRIPGVAVLPPGLDLARFDPDQTSPLKRSEFGIPQQAVLLGLIARLDHSKGADLVLDAIARLPRDESAAMHLLLVGGPLDSDYADSLRAQIRRLGLGDRIHWQGPVEDPERSLAACDLAINARRDPEPFGLSIIEAMLMRRPVIAHSLGAPADTVADGQTGWLYHAPEPETLAAALGRALAERAHWPAMGERARREALRRYHPSVVADRYERLLIAHVPARSAA